MAKFRIDILADLARQLTFSPHDTRVAQVASAEELLHTLDPAKAYPPDFVIYRITGYRAKHAERVHLPGAALQHDLGQLIETVSESLDLRAADHAEPVLAIDDVTEKFNVTSKTIQRWRRKGLPARRFLFPDGKRRGGVLLGRVQKVFSRHKEQGTPGGDISPGKHQERAGILPPAPPLASPLR